MNKLKQLLAVALVAVSVASVANAAEGQTVPDKKDGANCFSTAYTTVKGGVTTAATSVKNAVSHTPVVNSYVKNAYAQFVIGLGTKALVPAGLFVAYQQWKKKKENK